MSKRLVIKQFDCVPYADALALQNQLVSARSVDEIPDHLLLLEHTHTYTLGSAGHANYILMPPEERTRREVVVFQADRGGDVTYHGPGQLVGYPILKLPRTPDSRLRTDVVGYIRKLEQVIIQTLGDYGITSKRINGLAGVWVDTPQGEAKICAVGVKVNVRGVTKHGFALNIHPDMTYFEGIIPCGIHDKAVTSMANVLDEIPDRYEVITRLTKHFGTIFSYDTIEDVPTLENEIQHP